MPNFVFNICLAPRYFCCAFIFLRFPIFTPSSDNFAIHFPSSIQLSSSLSPLPPSHSFCVTFFFLSSHQRILCLLISVLNSFVFIFRLFCSVWSLCVHIQIFWMSHPLCFHSFWFFNFVVYAAPSILQRKNEQLLHRLSAHYFDFTSSVKWYWYGLWRYWWRIFLLT